MTPDSLEGLSDLALNEVFALEVAGWRFIEDGSGVAWFVPAGLPPATNLRVNRPVPPFSTYSDSVLPFLEKCNRWQAEQCKPDGVWMTVEAPTYHVAYASTFARSACIALIRAHRAAKV